MKTRGLKNALIVVVSLMRYNMKIIFANKFKYFLLAALSIFIGVTILNLLNPSATPDEATGYTLILIPGILLVFYPAAYGIQTDMDTRMIEILFGIPDYRYKVWLVRLFMIYAITFVIILMLSLLFSLTLNAVPVWELSIQVMAPILFIGATAFLAATAVRNGNGAAVVMVSAGLAFWFFRGQIESSEWNIFLNPFAMPRNSNPAIWANTTVNNRIYLMVGTLIAILWGLINMQKREKFI